MAKLRVLPFEYSGIEAVVILLDVSQAESMLPDAWRAYKMYNYPAVISPRDLSEQVRHSVFMLARMEIL